MFSTESGVEDPTVRAAMEAMFEEVAAFEDVIVTSPYEPAGATQISADGTVAFAAISLAAELDFTETSELGAEFADLAPELPGLQVEIGGNALAEFEPPESEFIGLAFAVVVLIVAFGSVLAMGLPIAVAVAGVGTGIGLIILISNLTTVPDFTTTIGAMIGLGVGIDYALFIVTRYREGLDAGSTPEQATRTAMDTAGRAVIFAGLTVIISLLGMLLIGLSFITGLAIGAAVTVGVTMIAAGVTMIAAVTLLPALLGFVRERIEVTRWRGLIAAGLVAVALLGVGLGFPLLALARIHRTRDPIRLPGHANRCPSEAGMMVCEQPIDPEQGAPVRCDHRTASTGLKRPSTTTAWWPTRGCCCRPRSPSISVCSSSSTPTSTSGLPRVGRTSGTSC